MIPTKTDLPGDTLAIGFPPEDDEDEEPVEENELLELEQELCLLEEKLLNFCCLKPSFSNTNLHYFILIKNIKVSGVEYLEVWKVD